MTIALRYAARSDVGLVRANNQDSGYAGPNLLVVADGMGGHAGGDVASAIAISALAHLDADTHTADGALAELEHSISDAHEDLVAHSTTHPELVGMGTTVTAILRNGDRLAMAHLGDSRAYLLRDGEITQVTTDHTFVQHLIDTGRISPAEAETHPQRNVVMRVLGDFDIDLTPDLSIREMHVGDRWLLCSDGLSGFVDISDLQRILTQYEDLDECAEELIELALDAGSTDNVTVVIAEVVDLDPDAEVDDTTQVVGSAAVTHGLPQDDTNPNPENPPEPDSRPTMGSMWSKLAAPSKGAKTSSEPVGIEKAESANPDEADEDPDEAQSPDEDAGTTSDTGDEGTETADTPTGTDESESPSKAESTRSATTARPKAPIQAQLTASDDDTQPRPGQKPKPRPAETTAVEPVEQAPRTPRRRPKAGPPVSDAPVHGEIEDFEAPQPAKRRPRWPVALTVIALILGALGTAGWLGYRWTQSQYYVGIAGGQVAVFQGVNASVGPWTLSHPVEYIGTPVDGLPPYVVERLEQTISADSLDDARDRAILIGLEAVSSGTEPGDGATTAPKGTSTP